MNPFEMVVLIVFISAVASVLNKRFGGGTKKSRIEQREQTRYSGQMVEEVRALKERIAVL